jgi:hypothetical protein
MKKALQQCIDFFIFGRYFISLASVFLYAETCTLLHENIAWQEAGLLFFATFFVYNVYYIGNSFTPFKYFKINAIVGFVVSIVFLFLCKYIAVIPAFIGFLLGCMYVYFSIKKKFDNSIVKICLLTLVWTVATTSLFIHNFNHVFAVVFLHRFVLIYILNLLFDIRDIEFDSLENKVTLATKYGLTKSYTLSYSLLALYMVVSCFMCIVLQQYFLVSAYLITAIALYFIIKKSISRKDEFYFLCFVDGMMWLEGALVLLIS